MYVLLICPSYNTKNVPNFMGTKSASVIEYDNFYSKITDIVKKKGILDEDKTRNWFYKLACEFEEEGNIDEFTKLTKGLIEFLVSKKLDNMAGIICSILVKLNRNNQNLKNMEDIAVRGIAIAKRSNDYVHTAARANDINIALRLKEPGSDKHVKYLKIQNEAIEYICRNYNEDIIQHCKTNTGELAPLENYECSLFYVKLDIAAFALLKEPKYAKTEFEKAKKMYEQIKYKFTPEICEKLEKKMDTLDHKYKMCGL